MTDPGEVAPEGSPARAAMKLIPISKLIDSLQDEFPDISDSKVRFLERRGLITPHRAESGFRRFSEDDVARMRWILTMQRDHFLPLRVIKERLDDGAAELPEAGSAGPIEAPELPARSPSSRFRAPGPESDRLTASDLGRLAGLSAGQLDELIQYGIIDPIETPDGVRFGRDELRVAKAAGAFLQRGIQARHLKAWRVAAEREAGMLEQVVTPLSHQSTPDAITRAREVADELIDQGNVIREAMIVKVLRESLGSTGD
ncbi:MAG: MerR family transcriptional regulator [Actinomycetota bacterium]